MVVFRKLSCSCTAHHGFLDRFKIFHGFGLLACLLFTKWWTASVGRSPCSLLVIAVCCFIYVWKRIVTFWKALFILVLKKITLFVFRKKFQFHCMILFVSKVLDVAHVGLPGWTEMVQCVCWTFARVGFIMKVKVVHLHQQGNVYCRLLRQECGPCWVYQDLGGGDGACLWGTVHGLFTVSEVWETSMLAGGSNHNVSVDKKAATSRSLFR